jgi:hypothetical protein
MTTQDTTSPAYHYARRKEKQEAEDHQTFIDGLKLLGFNKAMNTVVQLCEIASKNHIDGAMTIRAAVIAIQDEENAKHSA